MLKGRSFFQFYQTVTSSASEAMLDSSMKGILGQAQLFSSAVHEVKNGPGHPSPFK
jgi:hypothetical protein